MQPGRGSRHRAGCACVDRLVAFAIRVLGLPRDIRRQRHAAVGFEERQHVAREFEPCETLLLAQHPGLMAAGEPDQAARPQRLAGAGLHQRRVVVLHALQQDLDAAAALLHAVGTRRQHPRVVQHQQIPW